MPPRTSEGRHSIFRDTLTLLHAIVSSTVTIAAMAIPVPGAAQAGPVIELDVMTDNRVRGLSWSDGETAAQGYVSLPVTPALDVSAQVATLRGSDRHGGADAGIDLTGTYAGQSGLITWHGSLVGHLFAGGRGDLDYGEVQAGLGGTLGPVQLGASATYAPPQDAIGGSNFYGRIDGRVGFWGTPYSLRAHLGHSSGSVDDPLRAERLRPGGSYSDWAIGAEYNVTVVSFSLTYSDTDIRREDIRFPQASSHFGSRLVAGARVRF